MLKSVTPTLNVFSITWNLGPRCNFSCSYCPPRLHSKTSPHKTLAQLQEIWANIYNKTKHLQKQYKLSFTGGEVTINPDFLDFLDWLKTHYGDQIANMGFTTNGSASTQYYLQAIVLVDYISFSSHFLQMKNTKFYNNVLKTHVKAVKLKKNIFVNIMDEDIPEITELKQMCEKYRIPHAINEIDWDWQ